MAVVIRYAAGYPDPSALSAYSRKSRDAVAYVKNSYFEIAIGAADSINSVYWLARIPSSARIKPQSTFYVGAIAGLTSLSIGVDNLKGTKVANALVSAVDVHSGGAFSLVSAIAAANYAKELWQLLGLSSDPGGALDIYASVLAAPGAAGTLNGDIYWNVAGP